MIATHLGNAIVRYDDVLAIDKDYMSGLYERLNQLNAGDHQYTFSEIEVSKAPQRFVELQKLPSEDQQFIKTMNDTIHHCVKEYIRLFPVLTQTLRWFTQGYIIKYENGQSIGPHSDCNVAYAEDGVTPINTAPIQNILTCGLMLNDGYEGGETHYRPWGITTKPSAGSVLIYPSSFVGCHEVKPVTAGVRYAYLMWYGHGPADHVKHDLVPDIRSIQANQGFVPVGRI
jgi:predicted 2-oxoglutarate/Fe(II)-dependent dioxygenase YbiX